MTYRIDLRPYSSYSKDLLVMMIERKDREIEELQKQIEELKVKLTELRLIAHSLFQGGGRIKEEEELA